MVDGAVPACLPHFDQFRQRYELAIAAAHAQGKHAGGGGLVGDRQAQAHAIVQDVGAPNLKVQMDLYHCQISEGDISTRIRHDLPTGRIGHFQIAGVPDRHEPDGGELDYAHVFRVLDEVASACGWSGWVGCEYRPRLGDIAGGTSRGLAWRQALTAVA